MEERTGKTFEESVDKFVQKVDTVRERFAALQQRADQTPCQQQGTTPEVLEEFQTALEELHVAQEELKAQNEETRDRTSDAGSGTPALS